MPPANYSFIVLRIKSDNNFRFDINVSECIEPSMSRCIRIGHRFTRAGFDINNTYLLLLTSIAVIIAVILGFEFCVFVAGWRHALRSEWPFIIIINIAVIKYLNSLF